MVVVSTNVEDMMKMKQRNQNYFVSISLVGVIFKMVMSYFILNFNVNDENN